jgi:hypothetical protein
VVVDFVHTIPNGKFDIVLPAMLLIALAYLGWRRDEV